MADLPQHFSEEDRHDVYHVDLRPVEGLDTSADGICETGKDPREEYSHSSPTSVSSASGPSAITGGEQPSAIIGLTNPPLSMPHPKKFSHVNINKKFLSALTPAHAISASPIAKTLNSSQKLPHQATTPHPRLVTTKLTVTPQPSSTGGWSRPSSTVPSNAATPLPAVNPKPVGNSAAQNTPLLPSVGKVIQPQPRSLSNKRDGSAKPAWRVSQHAPILPSKLDETQSDFPTAAEVAQGRIPKNTDKRGNSDAATVHEQAVMAELMAEEDTFRGVHLDPNAHHWDEMEEDDDNFLAGVIEFEDGRQYKVQSTEVQVPWQSSPCENSRFLSSGDTESGGMTGECVSKADRFADDFDRSWPRSQTSPIQGPGPSREQRSSTPGTSPTSTSVQSPPGTSKVLFNERSNRLEPYAQQRHGGPGALPLSNRRNSRSDHSTSPTEQRRDAHAPLQGVQLLQKGPISGGPSRGDSRAPGDRPASVEGTRTRDHFPPRRDHPWQVYAPAGPDHIRVGSYGASQTRPPRDAHTNDRHRLPVMDTHNQNQNQRQVPPHLPVSGKRGSPVQIESDVLLRSPVPPPPASAIQTELQAPSVNSHATEDCVVASTTVTDVEEVRKAAMHSAAERARLRRQQEEEMREKEKERARRKAADIEARLKARGQEKDREEAVSEKHPVEEEVLGIIEAAISSVADKKRDDPSEDSSQRTSSRRLSMGRAPSSRGTPRPFTPSTPRGASFNTTAGMNVPSSDTDSWRRKDPPVTVWQLKPKRTEPPAQSILLTPVLAHAALDVKEGEQVDVVDFADLGKLVGSDQQPQPVAAATGRQYPSRAVAADFLDDAPMIHRSQVPSKADEGPWRRQSIHRQRSLSEKSIIPSSTEDGGVTMQVASERIHDATVSNVPASRPLSHEDHHRRLSGHHSNGLHKSPPGPHYREAPMSTLEDMISRVKGALASAAEAPKEASTSQKWLPPAKRPNSAYYDFPQADVAFANTAVEPPELSTLAWNIFPVKLAAASCPVPPPLKTELVWPRGQRHQRPEVHSFDVLDRRNATINDVIFDRPRFVQGKLKCLVMLPRSRSTSHVLENIPASPVVNLPITPPRLRNGKPKEALTSSWREPAVSWRTSVNEETGLDTVSRSPPPEAPAKNSISSTHATGPEPAAMLSTAESKQKMPVGSSVAFYRHTRIESTVVPQMPVQFIVNSELEGDSKAAQVPLESSSLGLGSPSMNATAASASMRVAPLGAKLDTVPTHVRELAKGSSTPPPPPPLTLLSQWSKSPRVFTMPLRDSPARAPDPEHLKAVWSQTPDKAQRQPINSLKGIADDLTGVPFSLQDMKSDEGATPPPSGSGPWTKMSAYEVTRAFQQVPASSSSTTTTQRHAPSSTITNGSASRNSGFAGSPLPMGQPTRPAYSPMAGHTPSTFMYTPVSPVPGHMVVNGTPPAAYGQPVWVPGPTGGVLRSPYLVPYPSPSGMYPSPMSGMPNTPPQNGTPGPRPGVPLVSPVMRPALPPMYGSPVLVHAHPVVSQPQTYSVSLQANRASMRPYDQHPSSQHIHPPIRSIPQHAGHTANYARPPW